ncbi:uncharacterized protein K460DRAFT_138373 [Cucurbitaria berberidis CBS 394.84]|uniref:Uncharacterized protein n=1 Tax=Cucurbitaria berberidis CBS 394.84 TaxID=1168544 RepID=A0A9P4GCC9_9PLEO|nr:uncharacterized protein K460DRAFT_138373 [Cucurbitaria berberidis CBS 394.84]KAF1843032.1 hypothetical protein K460DRAFT_138373 [Cucurbitaria berberidis CBS 394.84]
MIQLAPFQADISHVLYNCYTLCSQIVNAGPTEYTAQAKNVDDVCHPRSELPLLSVACSSNLRNPFPRCGSHRVMVANTLFILTANFKFEFSSFCPRLVPHRYSRLIPQNGEILRRRHDRLRTISWFASNGAFHYHFFSAKALLEEATLPGAAVGRRMGIDHLLKWNRRFLCDLLFVDVDCVTVG